MRKLFGGSLLLAFFVDTVTRLSTDNVLNNSNVTGTTLTQTLNQISSDISAPATVFRVETINDFFEKYGFPVDENNRITLPRGTFLIDSNNLDCGVYSFITSENVTFAGYSQNINRISSTQPNIVFLESTGADVFFVELQVSITGANSKVVQMNGTGLEAIEIVNSSWNSSVEWGTLDNIRQAFINGFFSVNAQRGFLITTGIDGYRMDNCRIINPVEYIARAAVGIPVGNVRVNTNSDLPSGCIAFQFDYDNFTDNSYLLKDGFYNGLGQVAKDFTDAGRDTDIAQDSRRSFFQNNQGNLGVNTSIGGTASVTTEITTPVAATNTRYKLLGTMVASKLVHFTLPNDNELTYGNTQNRLLDIFISATLRSNQDDTVVLWVQKWDDSAGAYVDVAKKSKLIQRLSGPRDIAEYVIFTETEMNDNDRIELWAENLTSTANITLEEDSIVKLEKQ